MPKLKHSEMRTIDHALDMVSGYVLDFSDRTMREFFEDEFGIDIYSEKYRFNGTSKAKHLRAFIEIEEIDREIKSGKPQIALDRLHTYCVKKFGHLLDARGKSFDKSAPLHGRAGIYIKEISAELSLSEMSTQIAKSVIGVLEKFNFVRNNQTLAHDNTLLSPAEARFIYDGVVAFLRFMKAIEKSRFE
jgi:hypothetical protein